MSGSLRSAITQATPGSTITFDHGLSGKTLSITKGTILMDKGLTLDASTLAQAITIEGSGADALFQCTAGGTNIFKTLRLTGGFSEGRGGAIQNNGDLVLSKCILSNNLANYGGAIYHQSGSLIVQKSALIENLAGFHGGAVYSESGVVVFEDCTLTGNMAGFNGGGICSLGDVMTIRNCTLASNTAGFNGGGIFSDTDLDSQQTTLLNSTLFNNIANMWGGGYYNHDGTSLLVQCTLTHNISSLGGGVCSYGDAYTQTTILSSIVAENSTDVDLAEGATNSFYSQGYNLVGTGGAIGEFNKTGDKLSSLAVLAPLGYYGGQTPTMPPLIASPAIDNGADSVTNMLSIDQRGYARASGQGVDIGAVEAQVSPIENLELRIESMWWSNGLLNFGFTNIPNMDFTVLVSTNAASPASEWTILGLAVQTTSGVYQYQDSDSINELKRFYRLALP